MQKLQTVNADTLLYEPLEKPSFVVDGLIPTGLTLFCGSQKIGKSWLMLKLCLCVSQGIPLWDMPTQEGDVFYLCLEDTFCRIQDRLFRLTDEASGRLHFAVASDKLSDGLIVQLEDYLKEYPDSRLIVIDTLQKVRTASKDNAYASDYGDISLIKDFADRHSLAVIVVHHIRKQNDSDVFNKVSGTTGLTGSADATFVLQQESRASNAAKLYVTGRDTPYQEFTLRFRDCSWELVERKEQEQLAKEAIPDVLFRLVDFMQDKGEWTGTATELLAAMGETETVPTVIWSENSMRSILRSPIYAGNLAGYKRIAANMKSKKRPSKLPEEWEVIPDTHEGIVTQEEFDTVQQLMTSRRREKNKGGFENIFSGVIKCADCGYALRAMSANRRKRPDIIDCVQYTCNNYGRYGNVMCTAHAIEARDLFNAVLADINRFADMAVNDERAVRAIEKRLTETDQSKAKAMEKEQKKLNKRLAELDRLFSSLYEDKVMERITERNFEMMSGKYQKEQLEIEARLREVTETLNKSYEKSQGIRDFLSLIRNYQGLKELDATVVNALIDKILVSEREKSSDGTVRQEIKIYYKFIGFVGELHITPTKRWTALPAKHCTVCGVEYVPGSAISKYCPVCAKKIQRERGIEGKRRSRERKRQACIELSAKNDRLSLTRRGSSTGT